MKLQFEPSYVSLGSTSEDKKKMLTFDSKDENIDISSKLNQLSLFRSTQAHKIDSPSSPVNSQDASLFTIFRSLSKNENVRFEHCY